MSLQWMFQHVQSEKLKKKKKKNLFNLLHQYNN